MKLHWYEKNQKHYNPEYIVESQFLFIKKIETPHQNKKKYF